MKKHVLIVANGEQPVSPQHWNRIKRAQPLICTDGAANWLLENQITPDVIIGDLDSISEGVRGGLSPEVIHHVGSQQNTDLEKALEYALDEGYDAATIIAATGKREDMTLANLYLVAKYAEKIHIQLLTNYSTIEAITDEYSSTAELGEKISLLPVGTVEGVTTTGLEYPLVNEDLELGTRGVSNRANTSQISISVKSGTLLIFRNFQ